MIRRAALNSSRISTAVHVNARRSLSSSTKIGNEFQLEIMDGEYEGIALMTMKRPKANALGRVMMDEFRAAIDRVRFDQSLRVVVLQSAFPKIFCAGADLKERVTMDQEEVARFVFGLRSAFTAMEQLPVPTIAAVEGAALGGGLELALACDMRVAGTNASFGAPETALAIIPGAGGTQRLPRLVGQARAMEMICTASRISAEEASSIGLVNRVVESGNALDSALDLAKRITPQGPVALRMAKSAVYRGMQTDIDSGMFIEQSCYAQTIRTEDRMEGLLAFKEKRKPVYKGC